MLAGISDFFVWRQIPLAILFLAVSIFGGGALLWVGGRFIVKTPKATFWRSVGTNLLAGSLGFCALVAIHLMSSAVGPTTRVTGLLVGLLVAWWVIKAMFGIRYRKAILAWLPTIGSSALAYALLALLLLPGLARARELARRGRCMDNLKGIGGAIKAKYGYSDYGAPWPADMADLMGLAKTSIRGRRPEELFRCPSAQSRRRSDYFYLHPEREPAGSAIIVCDLRGNHGGEVRYYLTASLSVRHATEAEFQTLLAKSFNAKFAAALRKAEGP